MLVYRIVQDQNRVNDLSGRGAWLYGGRWNSKGTYVLYTSENSSLAMLECLVHMEAANMPPSLYLVEIEIVETAPLFILPAQAYPGDWKQQEDIMCKLTGDNLIAEARHLAIQVKSAVNPGNYNWLLNPLFPGYEEMVSVKNITELDIDQRLK